MIDRLYLYGGSALLLLALGGFGGCQVQGRLDRGKIATAEAKAEKAAAALLASETALRGASDRFRIIDTETLAAEDRAAQARAAALASAKASTAERNQAQARAKSLEAQLARERSTCAEGEKQICGILLR